MSKIIIAEFHSMTQVTIEEGEFKTKIEVYYPRKEFGQDAPAKINWAS